MRFHHNFLPVALLTNHHSNPGSSNSGSTSPAWQVTNFNTNCSPGGCTYAFDIVGAADPKTHSPSFSTTCNGSENGPLAICDIHTVKAQMMPETAAWTVKVQHEWFASSGGYSLQYYAAGTHTVSANSGQNVKDASFSITPKHFYGVG